MAGTTLVDRALLRLSGEDVRGFLQGLVTNDVDAAGAGAAALGRAADRAGQGLFDFILWADGEDVLIDCEAEQADALARRLTSTACAAPIAIERDDGLAVHWSPDGEAADPRLPALGRRWLAPAGEARRGLARASPARSASPRASPSSAPTRPSGSNAMPPS